MWPVVNIEYKCIPNTFLNFQNRENTLLKQSKKIVQVTIYQKILYVREHEHIRPPVRIQYEHEGLRPEQSALDQIKDLIQHIYCTE